MLSNNKIFIYNLCFGLSKLYINSAGPESKVGLSYVNVVCVYGGRGGGWGLDVLKCFVRGGGAEFFLLAFVCVCVCGGGGQAQYLSFREKNNRPSSY